MAALSAARFNLAIRELQKRKKTKVAIMAVMAKYKASTTAL